MQTYKTIKDMPDLHGKRVLVRSELNVPIENGIVGDRYRVEMAVPTLKELANRGAKVIVIAHIGRNPSDSLQPVFEVLREHISEVKFTPSLTGENVVQAISELPDGGVLLLENVRSHAGETENDQVLADTLASYADYYVNDAFGATHRAHTSVVGIPARIPSFAGLLLEKELTELSRGLVPDSPSLFILGGAKFETKEPLLESALNRYDSVFIGGALANDFLRAQGFQIGRSLVSEYGTEKMLGFISTGKLLLPVDVVVETNNGTHTKSIDNVEHDDKIVDVGPETITELGMKIAHAKSILWNGPLGLYEGGYMDSTKSVAQLISDTQGTSIVGGGDTVAAIRTLKLEDRFGFLSTGGGAMLDYLVEGKLPGVDALEKSPAPK